MSDYPLSRRWFLTGSAAFSLGTLALNHAAFASDLISPTSLQPHYPLSGSGKEWDRFVAYDPQTDPDAPFFKSYMGLAPRIASFTATQAHRHLSPKASAASLIGVYLRLDDQEAELFRTRYMTNSQDWVHVERFWQYQDIVVSWNGTGLVPNPALIDATHRNGALCLGTMFQPDKRFFDQTVLNHEAVAEKLVQLCSYFGFDGYFINFEDYKPSDADQVRGLITALRQKARQAGLVHFHIQFYDGHTNPKSAWPQPDGSPHPRQDQFSANSMMLDQGWSNYHLTQGCCSGRPLISETKTLPPLSQDLIAKTYYGLQLYPGPGYLGLSAPLIIDPNEGGVRGGLQIYSAEDGLRKMRHARLDRLIIQPQSGAEISYWRDPSTRRQAWYGLHRHFWSGQSGNPAQDNAPSAQQIEAYGSVYSRKVYTDYVSPGAKSDQMNLPISYGVANFITERSVVGQDGFITHFNTGEGEAFFMEGVARSGPWINLGSQDILPTWMWWREPLQSGDGPLIDVDFDFTTGFNGGSSLRLSGTAETIDTQVHLYKCDMKLTAKTRLDLVFKTANLKLEPIIIGLVFQDSPTETSWIRLDHGQIKPLSDWQDGHFNLSAFKGRRLAVIKLAYSPQKGSEPKSAEAFSFHLGRLSLFNEPEAKSALTRPIGFKIQQSRLSEDKKSAQLRLNWHYDSHCAYYDLMTRPKGQDRLDWQGRISGDHYYIQQLLKQSEETVTQIILLPSDKYGKSHPNMAQTLEFNWQDDQGRPS